MNDLKSLNCVEINGFDAYNVANEVPIEVNNLPIDFETFSGFNPSCENALSPPAISVNAAPAPSTASVPFSTKFSS